MELLNDLFRKHSFTDNYMKIKSEFYFLFVITLFLFSCSAVTQLSQQKAIKGPEFAPYTGLKTSIAVLDFENRTAEGDSKFGSAVSDILVSLLVRSGRFTVLERQFINQILQEQALGQSGAITEDTAPQVGQLLGVQSLIWGEILEAHQRTGSHTFKDDDEDKKDNWALKLKASVAQIKLHYRLINVTTGEILHANEVNGTELRPGFGIETKDFDFNDMFEFDQTLIGIATRKAVNSMAVEIVNNATKVEWVGKVIRVKEDTVIYVTPGQSSGVKIGDMFQIFSKPDELSSDEVEIQDVLEKGIIKVDGFIGDKVAKAVLVKGGAIMQGDRVKPFIIQ